MPTCCDSQKIFGERAKSNENAFYRVSTFRPRSYVVDIVLARLKDVIYLLQKLCVERCGFSVQFGNVNKVPCMVLLTCPDRRSKKLASLFVSSPSTLRIIPQISDFWGSETLKRCSFGRVLGPCRFAAFEYPGKRVSRSSWIMHMLSKEYVPKALESGRRSCGRGSWGGEGGRANYRDKARFQFRLLLSVIADTTSIR